MSFALADHAAELERIERLIRDAEASGGSERANYQLFVIGLTEALGLPRPAMAAETNRLNDYVFERRVDFKHPDGTRTAGFVDCYKRGCFVLEAKQSAKRQTKRPPDSQLALLSEEDTQTRPGHAKRGTRGWDRVMLAARAQAEDYARALPVEHGYPPFLMVMDVGNAIEIYADFSGQGKNYAHFPDRQSYRILLDDLRDERITGRLKAIWTDPLSLDPARISAEVTRDIAERLARIAKGLEARHDAKDVAEFLMRCLFTMFAEDVKLLPDLGFQKLLKDMKLTPKNFVPALESLWKAMDEGSYAPYLNTTLKKFNGALFKERKALPLERDEIIELYIASTKDWSDVEPAIFGTLLERALGVSERSRLGAHYTPRAYVERLVIPTIIEPLRAEWASVRTRVDELRAAGLISGALDAVKAFHHRLCTIRVLDPACGTGNFLYVSLELMKKLEGEVLEALDDLGEDAPKFVMTGETVDPHQFYGLEINKRAVPIADLVLWIGYLKWQLKTAGLASIGEPVLDAYGTIRHQDSILAFDRQEFLRDDEGRPLSRWDGVTKMPHPVTGEEIPDPDATLPLVTYVNPRPAKWPEADFIVGNPPFIGGKDMRAELGDGYAEACWKARPHLPGGADFVMHFWDEAATRLLAKPANGGANRLRRFGFITTNLVTQTFSRRVIERHMAAKAPLSLTFAVPDHPWLKASDKAAVRIAMTVAEAGERDGILAEVASEAGLNTDTPQVELGAKQGKIRANLTIGPDLDSATALISNDQISSPGVKLHGKGFIIKPAQAISLGLGKIEGLEKHILDYRNGRDIAQRPRGVKVIDLYPLTAEEVQTRFPAVYQHVLTKVKPEREAKVGASKDMTAYAEKWWLFGKVRNEMRDFLDGLPRYIATVETTKHRTFQFLDASIRPDNMIVSIGMDSATDFAVLSSRLHIEWSLAMGGTPEDRPRYSKSRTFDPFPFPLCCSPEACAADPALAAQAENLGRLGERLDAFRKERLAEHKFLTMTGLYNVLERLRELEWAGRRRTADAYRSSETPPSALPGISPSRGEIIPIANDGAVSPLEAGISKSLEVDEEVISPLEGEMPGRAEGGVSHERSPPNDGENTPHPTASRPFSPARGEGKSAIPPLTDAERDIHEAGLVSVLKELHDEIDRAVFDAYGWGDLAEKLVGRPGATMPSPYNSPEQEAAEEELLTRLVALNRERAAEEKRGVVRWLRPDYQIAKLGKKAPTAREEQIEADIAVIELATKPKWPTDGLEQIRIVRALLAGAPGPALPDAIAAAFDGKISGKRRDRVSEVLETLVATGAARAGEAGGARRFFVAR